MSPKWRTCDISKKPHKHHIMKLGQQLFKKDQSIWGKPIIAYDQTKMDTLFSDIKQTEGHEGEITFTSAPAPTVSLETELYLMLHA